MAQQRQIWASIGTAFLACAAPGALADDDTEKVGLAAALGLTAADGKTTLGEGAGAIEAALLETDAINQAGAIIAALAQTKRTGNILLVTKGEAINAAAYAAIKRRITALTGYMANTPCPPPPAAVRTNTKKKDKNNNEMNGALPLDGSEEEEKDSKTRTGLSVADIVPALATSTSFSSIALTVEDRAILSAILLNRNAMLKSGATPSIPARWQAADLTARADSDVASNITFIIPSELQGDPANSQILNAYNNMLKEADSKRYCSGRDEKVKAAISAVEAYAQSLNAVADKAPVAPLSLAIQQEKLYQTSAPKILRVSVEQSGGTSRTSSGIWYTLGFPNAAKVSAGLIVSFRLIDTRSGTTESAGIVRCALPYAGLRSIKHFAKPELETGEQGVPPRKATCSYIAG